MNSQVIFKIITLALWKNVQHEPENGVGLHQNYQHIMYSLPSNKPTAMIHTPKLNKTCSISEAAYSAGQSYM